MPNSNNALKVLIVEDDDGIREAMRLLLTLAGYTVCATATVRDAVSKLNGQTHVLLDLNLFDGSGVEVLRVIRREYSTTTVALTTAEANDSLLLADALRYIPDAVFRKPIDVNRLLTWLQNQP